MVNGVNSGAAASTVAFSYTFTEDTTFYYACEPHIGLNMFGQVIVGDGGAAPAAEESSTDSEDTPGFLLTSSLLAFIGAVAVLSRRNTEE